MPPLGYRRTTPSAAGESDAPHIVPDGRAARGTLRSLALLVDRLATRADGQDSARDPAAASVVRDALRQYTARIRENPMQCRIVDGQFVLAGDAVDRGLTRDDPLLGTLLVRCVALGIGSITVRQGAAPAELLTLATFLARARPGESTTAVGHTPTSMSTVADPQPRELLRLWSVLVTPEHAPGGPPLSKPVGAEPIVPRRTTAGAGDTPFRGVPIAHADGRGSAGTPAGPAGGDTSPEEDARAPLPAIARLAAAHDDVVATRAVDILVEMVDQAELRGHARTLEQITTAAIAQLHVVGTGAGRLALERLLRRLQHRGSLELLARRLPFAYDRRGLLELLSRAGETAVDILVRQLMEVEDAAARRAYFDSIVQLDLAGPALFDLVRDARWYVVRNAVALLGEMGVEQADIVLLPLLQHDDDRIRIAAARALVRLGTAKALQGLHQAIDDRHAEVRRLAAVSYALTPGTAGMVRPPAARLAMALEKETDEDAALEMLASLGKLGSADAMQRLLRIALPQPQMGEGGEPMREAWLRIAALEALVKARGNAVRPQVEALLHDADPEVAQAALRLRG